LHYKVNNQKNISLNSSKIMSVYYFAEHHPLKKWK